MKKVFYSLFALAMTAMTFTSCEDVPMPYDQPGNGGDDPVVIEPTGSGTAEDPYNVTKALEVVSAMEANAESSENVYIKGKVVSINTNYDESGTFGNAVFYISDDGTNKNQFYVYRALYLGNKKYSSGNVLEENDEVIICGKVVNYNGTTPETVQSKAFLYSLNGVTEGGGGSSEVKEITCAQAVELTNQLDDNATSAETYAITGYITEVFGAVSRGQQSFWMADAKDGGKVFEAYYANLPEGVTEFKKGSKVKITGNLMKYVKDNNVTPEMKNPDVVILENGNDEPEQPSGDAKGDGTLENPYNPLGAINAVKDLTWTSNTEYQKTGDVYVKGKISRIADKGTYGESGTYGNASFYISEDGSQKDEFYCFRILYLGNQKYTSGTDIQVGDEVIIYGKLMNYRSNTPETVANEAYLYQLGSNGGNGGDGGGNDTSAGNVTKAVEGNVVTLTVPDTQEGGSITADLNAQGWESGKAVNPATITLSDGTTITFAKGDGSNTPAYYDTTKGVRVYAKNTITISGKAVAKVVMKCDTYNNTDYTGNSQLYATADGTTFTICNDYTEAKGGNQLRVQTITITYAK